MARHLVWLTGFASTLTACGGDASGGTTGPGSDPGAGGGPSITVTGTVVDNCLVPMPTVTVWIRGKGTTQTDNAGAFVFKNVVAPYDIGYVSAPGFLQSFNIVRIFQGVTRATVRLPFPEYGAVRAGDIAGTLSGSGVAFPSPLSRISQIFFAAPGDLGTSHQITDAAYLIQPTWCGPTSETGTVYALQWTPDTLGTTVYDGLGEFDGVTAQNDGLLPDQNMVMSTVATGTVTGTATVPSGYSVTSKTFSLAANLTTVLPDLGADKTAAAAFGLTAPVVPGTSLTVEVRAASSGRITLGRQQGLAPGASGVSLVLLPAPAPALPASNATVDLAKQSFQWSAFGGGLHVLWVSVNVPALSSQLTYDVITAGSSATLLQPSDLGITFVPPTATGMWRIAGLAGPSVDALLDPSAVVRFGPDPDGYPLLPHDAASGLPAAEAVSEYRFFQTR